jgi:predicted ATPase
MAEGSVAFYRGDLVTARAHLEASLRRCDPPLLALSASGGFADGVIILTVLAQALWALGYADQAQARGQEALALAQQLEHPPSLVYATAYAAHLCQYRRDAVATQTHADAVMTMAAAQGFGHRREHGRILWGWARAMQGHAATSVAHIQQGWSAVQGTGLKLSHPYWLALLAEAYGQAGQPEAGLAVLTDACTLVAATEERWWEAELSRLQGALLLHLSRPDVPQAEACFQQALEVARRQQARALELRAALSLSRLRQQQNQRQAARELLAPIYGWFTEGFDTSDLQDAKALLGELA